MHIAYGVDTGSIEDPEQLVYIDGLDDDIDFDDLEFWLRDNWQDMNTTPMVPYDRIVGSFTLAMLAENVPLKTVQEVLQTVEDAIGNNYFG